MTHNPQRLLTAVFAVAMSTLVCGESTLAVRVTPRISYAPTTIRFTVVIEPDAHNRKACLSYDGGEASESCWQVDGANHPRTRWFERRVGASGEYFAIVRLLRLTATGDGETITTTQQFTILDPGTPFVR